MYIKEIFMLLSWPVTIYISYLLVRFLLKKFENKIQSKQEN